MYRFDLNIDAIKHDEFVKNHELCNLLQSYSWSKIKNNWKSQIVGVYEDDKLVASSLVLIKPLPLGFTMLYLPRGPILDFNNTTLVEVFFNGLVEYAKHQKCLFIKFDPNIHYKDYKIEDSKVAVVNDINVTMDNLAKIGAIHLGFPKAMSEVIQPRYQANIYNSATYMEDLPKHTKRFINKANKQNVEVVKVDKTRVEEFSKVIALTEERKNISLRNSDYFNLLMDTYQDDTWLYLAQVDIKKNLIDLYARKEEAEKELSTVLENARKKINALNETLASVNQKIVEFEEFKKIYPNEIVVAGVLGVKYGNTMEMLYAGTNTEFKKLMPQYKIYTTMFVDAFKQDIKFCNLGGVEGSLDDGLTEFKSGFNPIINEFIGEFDIPVNKLLYSLSQKAYKIRKNLYKKK